MWVFLYFSKFPRVSIRGRSLGTRAKFIGKILILLFLKGRRPALSLLMGPFVRGAQLEGFRPANLAAYMVL